LTNSIIPINHQYTLPIISMFSISYLHTIISITKWQAWYYRWFPWDVILTSQLTNLLVSHWMFYYYVRSMYKATNVYWWFIGNVYWWFIQFFWYLIFLPSRKNNTLLICFLLLYIADSDVTIDKSSCFALDVLLLCEVYV
jgi:hypothetical protein